MRVLIVATQVRLPGTHGGTTHVGELIRNLRRYGPVLTLAQRGSTDEGTVGVSWSVGYPRVIKHLIPAAYLPKSLAAARAFAPDVIYERGSSYGLGAMLSVALGVPMLCMVLDEHHSPLSLRRAERIIATTPEVVPPAFRDKMVEVSWGANHELFSPDVEPIDGAKMPPFAGTTVCYVGSFKRWHGVETLVEAAARLGDRAVRFLMVGDGPLRARLEADIAARSLSDRFVFSGAVAYEQVPSWVAAADVCVAPFRPDLHPRSANGFILDPLKVFEYLAMAKPTITVDTPNIRKLLSDREHARLVEPGDADAIVGAIEALVSEPAEARAMAERGRARVLERHTWSAHADHLHQLFGELTAS